MRSAFKQLYNFIFRTRQRGLIVKTVWYSAVARFRVFFFPGNRLHRYLGELGVETGTEIPDIEWRRSIAQVSRVVAKVARWAPWESKCLVQAMVAQRLLRDNGMCSTLYLGVGRDTLDNKMVAHAWLRCGPYNVCGGKGEGYATVAKFKM